MIRTSERRLPGAVHQRGYRNYAILKMQGDLGYEERQAEACRWATRSEERRVSQDV